MKLEVKFLSVGCGDCISIRFLSEDCYYRNILIDSGTYKGDIYENTLKKEIQSIIERNEKIDLWIITHIDDDHIGGILRLIKDTGFLAKVDLTETAFWFNYSQYDYDTGIKDSKLKSVSQGMRLREFLSKNSKLVECVTNEKVEIPFFNVKIKPLSPSLITYKSLIDKWGNEEIKIRKQSLSNLKSASGSNDYSVKIQDFPLDKFNEDDSTENASSIGFLFEYADLKFLITADSLPTTLFESLKALGYSKTNKLKLSFMQLPHHGNKKNVNNELLEVIECDNFVISADGVNRHNLPNKEALARVIRNFDSPSINFHLTHKNNLTESVFYVDGNLPNVHLNFPDIGTYFINFKYD